MKDEIIAQLAQKKIVEKLIKSATKSGDNLDDLAQDLYISLLQKDEDLITSLYERGQLCFYIKAMIKKNL